MIDEIARDAKDHSGDTLIYRNWTAADNKVIQAGAFAGETYTMAFRAGPTSQPAQTGIEVDVGDANEWDHGEINEDVATAGFALNRMQLPGATINSVAGTNRTLNLDDMDQVIHNINRMLGTVGGWMNTLQSRAEGLSLHIINVSESLSRIEDADIAEESSEFIRAQITQQSATAAFTQANSTPGIAVDLLP